MSGYSEMSDQDIAPRHEYGEENQIREFFTFVREYFEIEQKWDEVQQFGTDHPVASLFLIVTMATCAIPVAVFSVFVVGSIIVSVSGFVFFEGTIIAIAGFALVAVLLVAGMFAVGFSLFLLAGYHAFTFAGNLLEKVKGHMPALPGFITGQPAKID